MTKNKTIRVLHVAEAAGGVERYLETLFKYSSDEVENILVCSQNFDVNKFKDISDRVIVLRMEHEVSLRSDIKVEKTLRNIIKQLKPDIVYAHSSKAGAFARIADLGLHNKIIYNPHGWAFNMKQSVPKKELYKWVERISALFCDKIVCISKAEKESALKGIISSSKKLKIINNGIDFDEFYKEAKQSIKIPIPDGSFVVGMVGRLSNQKAPDIFVKAAELIKKKIPNAYFLMVGDGELRLIIENQIKASGLEDSFYITGWVENPAAYMKLMDVGMLLSRWEGFGLVLPEFMLAQVPIIATNVDAIPEIIKNSKNGMLVEQDDFINASKVVLKIHDNSILKNSLIRQANRIVVDYYDGSVMAKRTQLLYKNLIKKTN